MIWTPMTDEKPHLEAAMEQLEEIMGKIASKDDVFYKELEKVYRELEAENADGIREVQ